MRLLFTMDAKNYDPGGSRFTRPSARAVILLPERRIALVHALRYDYYKFPGGGIEPGEDPVSALIRETAEETGLRVLPETVRPYGRVYRIEKGDPEEIFEQDNFYYFCRTEETPGSQRLDSAEQEEGFALAFVSPETAIAANEAAARGEHGGDFMYRRMAWREAGVLRLLVDERYFSPTSSVF